MIHAKSRTNGFTIIELIVIIVVIGILVAITIVSYAAITTNAKKQVVQTDARTVAAALTKYKAENGGYPTQAQFSALSFQSVQSTFQYSYDSAAGTYCLTSSVVGASSFLRSGSSTTSDGGCPGHGVDGASPLTNLATNPSGVSLTGYSSAGATGTTAVQPSGGYTGATYIRRSFNAAGAGGLYYGTATTNLALEAGKTYTAAGWVRSSKTVSTRITIEWKSASATVGTTSSAFTNVGTSWVRLSASGVAPAGTIRATLTFYVNGSLWANLDTQDLDGVMMYEGSTLYNFADGTSTNWVWNGTADASTSTGPAL